MIKCCVEYVRDFFYYGGDGEKISVIMGLYVY